MPMSPRLLRPRASGAFSPRSIAGLAAWWDANATSSLTLDGSSNVSTWADLSGNGVNATQTTANNRPTPTAGGLNGKQVLTFDGNNDGLSFTGTARTDETIFIVGRCDYSDGKFHQWISDSSSGFGLVAQTRSFSTNPVNAYLGGFTSGTNAILWSSPFGVAIGPIVFSIVRSSAAGGQLFSNGVSRGTCTTSPSFALSRIGQGPSSGFLLGYIAEICIYSRALSTSERQTLERYLGTKWGITVA